MTALVLPAPAKLNLFLHITGRRADGYHLLQTLFIFLDFADEISLSVRGDGQICRVSEVANVSAEDDLTVRAARLLQQFTGCHLGADIGVLKRIPMGGGLGGGSSNAATVLKGLNHLWECGLDDDELAKLGLSLGADVPVFVKGKAAWAEGVGEVLTPINMDLGHYVVIHPGVHVSTAEVFSKKELTRNTPIIKVAAFFDGDSNNAFQPVVEKYYPEVAEAIEWLSEYSQTRLTGSGSCLFAPVKNQLEGQTILKKLPKKWLGFHAKGMLESALHKRLSSL